MVSRHISFVRDKLLKIGVKTVILRKKKKKKVVPEIPLEKDETSV